MVRGAKKAGSQYYEDGGGGAAESLEFVRRENQAGARARTFLGDHHWDPSGARRVGGEDTLGEPQPLWSMTSVWIGALGPGKESPHPSPFGAQPKGWPWLWRFSAWRAGFVDLGSVTHPWAGGRGAPPRTPRGGGGQLECLGNQKKNTWEGGREGGGIGMSWKQKKTTFFTENRMKKNG